MKSNPSKLKIALGIVVVCLILGIAIMALYSPVIFQRGNPIPYLRAAAKLNDDTQYVQVKQTESESIYITRKGESDALLRMFAEGTGAVFQEQLGSTYIFSDDDKEWLLESEIYWKIYTVWVVPIFSNDGNAQNHEQASHLLSLNVKVIEIVEDNDNRFLVEALESYKDKISQGDIISVASDSAEVSDILRAYQENNDFRIYFPKIDDTADGISVTCLDVVQYDSNGEVIQQ